MITHDESLAEEKIKHKRRDFFISALTLIVLLTFNFVIWQVIKVNFFVQARNNVKEYTEDIAYLFKQKQAKYLIYLNSVRSFFSSVDNITRDQFQAYSDKLFNGIVGDGKEIKRIVFVEKADKRSVFEQKIKSEPTKIPNQFYYFTIFPEGERSQYYVINYVYPFENNKNVFGYDILAHNKFSSFVREAVDNNATVITDNHIFVADEKILMIAPIYFNNISTLRSVEERRKYLKGFVILFLNPDRSFENIFEYQENYKVNYSLYDGKLNWQQIKLAKPIYEEINDGYRKYRKADQVVFKNLEDIEINGKKYTLIVDAAYVNQQNLFEKYFPDVYLVLSDLVILVYFYIMIHTRSCNDITNNEEEN